MKLNGELRRGDLHLMLDLAFGPGLTAVVGPNGAGKTSLLRVVAGLDRLAAGSLSLDGRPLDAPQDRVFVPSHQRPIAMAFQDHRLFPHLRVVDNIAYPLRRRGVGRDEARRRVASVLEAVGVHDVASARPSALSGGQQQRVAIGRALATPAEVLLLDEPLASVDDDSRVLLREVLTTTSHPTIVWVTHDPADAGHARSVISIEGLAVRQTAAP